MRTGMLAFPLLGRLNHTSQVVYASESHFSVFFRKGKRTEEGGGKRQGGRERHSHRSSGSSLELLSVDQGLFCPELSLGPKRGRQTITLIQILRKSFP